MSLSLILIQLYQWCARFRAAQHGFANGLGSGHGLGCPGGLLPTSGAVGCALTERSRNEVGLSCLRVEIVGVMNARGVDWCVIRDGCGRSFMGECGEVGDFRC